MLTDPTSGTASLYFQVIEGSIVGFCCFLVCLVDWPVSLFFGSNGY